MNRTFSTIIRLVTCILLVMILLIYGTLSAHAQGDEGIEAKFVASLTKATLKGTWAPVQKGKLGEDRRDDSYRIARVEKSDQDKWTVLSVVTVRDREIEFPIPAKIRFAGDTAILILDNVRAAPGNANWSARVMFHEDVYSGRWWETENKEHGGTIAGTISR